MAVSKSIAEAAVSGINMDVASALAGYFAGHRDGKHRSKTLAMAHKTGAARVTFFQKKVTRSVKTGEKEEVVIKKGWHGTSTEEIVKVPIMTPQIFWEDQKEEDEQQLVSLALKSSPSPTYYKHVTYPDSRFHFVSPLPSFVKAYEVILGNGGSKSIAELDRLSIVIIVGQGTNHRIVTVMAESSVDVANWQKLV